MSNVQVTGIMTPNGFIQEPIKKKSNNKHQTIDIAEGSSYNHQMQNNFMAYNPQQMK